MKEKQDLVYSMTRTGATWPGDRVTVGDRQSGNALSEYGIVLALLAVAAIGALMLLGSSLRDALAMTSNGLVNANAQTTATPADPPPDPSGEDNPPANEPTAPMPGLASVHFDLGGGKTIQLSNYPVDPTKSVQTAGASGTTDRVAAALRQLADQLLAAGEITETGHKSLVGLANTGHKMVAGEAEVEKRIRACGTQDMACLFGTENGDYVYSYPDGYPTELLFKSLYYQEEGFMGPTRGLMIDELHRALTDAQDSGALTNPQVRRMVEIMTQQIMQMGVEFGDVVGDSYYAHKIGVEGGHGVALPDYVTDYARRVSESSHIQSANICRLGGDQDTGVQCQ